MRTFATPPGGGQPFGDIRFEGTFSVAIKDAANESQVVITCTFPQNYVYRVTSFLIQGRAAAASVFTPATGFEIAWRCRFTGGAQGDQNFFPLINSMSYTDLAAEAFKFEPDSETSDFATFFKPDHELASYIIDAGSGAATMVAGIMDSSADATVLTFFDFSLLASIYTVDQYNKAPMNTPAWVIGG